MKIAIIGSDAKERAEVVEKIMNKWTCFVSPTVTVADVIGEDVLKECDMYEKKKHNGVLATLNSSMEKFLWMKIILIENQMKKYKKNRNVLFCGCTMDVLMEAIQAFLDGLVSEGFIDKVVGRNRKVMLGLDLIYMTKGAEIEKAYLEKVLVKVEKKSETDEEETSDVEGDASKKEEKEPEYEYVLPETLTDEQSQIKRQFDFEGLYRNYLDKYFKDNGKSFSYMFPEEGAAMEKFLSSDPVSELGDIIDEHGNLAGEYRDPEEIQKLLDVFKGESRTTIAKILMSDNKVTFDKAFPSLSNDVKINKD